LINSTDRWRTGRKDRIRNAYEDANKLHLQALENLAAAEKKLQAHQLLSAGQLTEKLADLIPAAPAADDPKAVADAMASTNEAAAASVAAAAAEVAAAELKTAAAAEKAAANKTALTDTRAKAPVDEA
jgi:hypothetical protein